MDLQGETLISAPRERVWAALNDPIVLARCIDGVESLDKVGDSRFEGKLNAKVGPVRASFTGGVDLLNLDPPNGYTISGEGKGGVAGFAKGSADVKLVDEAMPDGSLGTRLSYVARSTVGGKLAQLGARLIEGTARGYAESFFAKLKAEVEAPLPDDAPAPVAPSAEAKRDMRLSPFVWAGGLALLVLLIAWLILAS
ncbi:MAG: carbon monoxide dehydrogenase subunit G [Sphingomonadaceae bacterium]|nr:carbon monoxide dehydrogenase subunit G [Sphingomonadaceae bacterium]